MFIYWNEGFGIMDVFDIEFYFISFLNMLLYCGVYDIYWYKFKDEYIVCKLLYKFVIDL